MLYYTYELPVLVVIVSINILIKCALEICCIVFSWTHVQCCCVHFDICPTMLTCVHNLVYSCVNKPFFTTGE